jgi:hypothetical protein
MLRLRHWPLLSGSLLVCLATLSCSSSEHTVGRPAGGSEPAAASGESAPGAPGTNGSREANGAPVANGQNGNGGGAEAPGAPIKIPDVIQSQGLPVSDVMASLQNGVPLPGESNAYDGIIAQCGGHLCVTIKTRPGTAAQGAGGVTQCESTGHTDPAAGSVVYPGSTIWILTGTLPCTSSPTPGGDQSSPTPDSGQSSPTPDSGQSSPTPGSESSTGTPSP